ncbi:recombinase family protein [Candidatus Falkowbacteria bacterium]|nr:recombinase family protein [Candidatus Falkowbacteria bacterium]
MPKGIIYYRVSTEDQAQNGVSLEQQKKACLEYALNHDIEIVKLFHDDGVSAKTTNRKGLQELLSYCQKNYKNIDAVIVYKIDRLSRNVKDYATILMALEELKIKFISATETVDKTPSGKLIGTIMASFAQFDNDVRSERVSSCMLEKIKQGIWCYKAPLGYLNSRDEQNKAIITIDRPRAEIIKMAFEKFSTGAYQMEEIRKLMIKAGFKSWKNKELSNQTLFKILTDKFCIGIMTVNGQEYPGTHETIIDEATFYKCQRYINKGNKGDRISASTPNETFPLRHFILCPNCRRPLTACMSKSKSGKLYPFYKCYNKACQGYKSISKDKLEDEFHDLLRRITPSEDVLKNLKKILLDVFNEKIDEEKQNSKSSKEKLAILQSEKAKLIEMKKKDLLDDEDFKNEMEKVKQNISNAQATACDQPAYDKNIFKEVDKVFKVLSNLATVYRKADYQDKLKYQCLIFPEKPVFDFSENRTPKLSLILQTKKELASASSPIVVPRGIEPLLPG